MKVYIYSKCSTCKKALKWLDEKGIDYKALPIRETPPSIKELKAMLGYYNGEIKRLFNTSSQDYRDANLKERLPDLSEKEAFAILQETGNLVKRPFAIDKNKGVVGFKEAEWEEKLL